MAELYAGCARSQKSRDFVLTASLFMVTLHSITLDIECDLRFRRHQTSLMRTDRTSMEMSYGTENPACIGVAQ